MKDLKYLIFSVLSILLISCKADPWNDVTDGGWNHERTILDIKFEGQAGLATIETVDAENGMITLKISPDLVTDMSRVKIESLSVSYQAIPSVKQGETIDFTSSNPTITVVSQMGESRVYSINMEKFEETLVGIYSIDDLWVYGGTGPMYGGTSTVRVMAKSWCWTSGETSPESECDNYLVFKMTEIMADGNTTGECINYGGEDANWWDCIFLAKYNKLGTGDLNLEHFYRSIPKGKSTWIRNYADNTITFISADGAKTVASLLGADTYVLYDDGKYTRKITVPNQALQFVLKGKEDWANTYTDYNTFAANPSKYFIMVTKKPGGYVIPEESMTLPD